MRALIVCDNHGPFPAALLERRPLCLMPLGAKPVLQHILENLFRMGIKRVTLAVSEQADYVQGFFGTGQRWGLDVEYLLTRGFDGILETIRLAAPAPDEELLVIPALTISNADPILLAGSEGIDKGPLAILWGGEDERPGPEYLLLTGAQAATLAPMALSAREAIKTAGARMLRAEDPALLVWDLPAYWEANRMLLQGEAPFGPLPARPGARTRVHPRALVQGQVLLDEAVEVGAACQIGPMAVICSHCILDDGVEARECVILPGTFVGRNTSVVRAIADQGLLVGIDDLSELHVPDPFILGPASAISVSGLVWEVGQRVLALVALMAALPVAGVFALRGMLSKRFWIKKTVVVSREISSLSGQKRFVEVDMHLASVRSSVLSCLPALWDVFKGRLALVGVEPITPQEASAWVGGWAEPRFSCRAGLVSPWHAERAGETEEVERRVMEIYYAQTRTPGGDVKILWGALKRFFSGAPQPPR